MQLAVAIDPMAIRVLDMLRIALAACLVVGGVAACSEDADCATESVTTDSGLTYQDLECGEGEAAARGDGVLVHYTGTLEDGEEFDSSVGRDPFAVRIGGGQVIEGWEEGLVGMRTGGTRKLTIPPDLGYGKDGYPPVIPPDATLIFEIRLVEITDQS